MLDSVLGLIIVLIYINDIHRTIIFSNNTIFANDSKVLKGDDRMGNRANIQTNLVAFIQWEQKHDKQMNDSKSHSIHFGKKAAFQQPNRQESRHEPQSKRLDLQDFQV